MNTKTFTVSEAENRLRLGHTKVAELIRTGELKSIKVGRRRLIPEMAIQDFIESRLSP